MAITNVIEATAFTTELRKDGDVYFKLAKYMFRVKLTLHHGEKQGGTFNNFWTRAVFFVDFLYISI